ncbi:MAG: DUF4328 domain-containing protein [Rhodococcus sp.]|nr:DUF4328 domain-containing protein [Rhodococcus sp. (in: high G+C Gram-positive bacteria)]
MINIQVCARCATRWQNQGQPMQWCPKCHGVLLHPFTPGSNSQRSFRWIARPPKSASRARSVAAPAQDSPTPRYTQIPRWGLQDRLPEPSTHRDWSTAAVNNAPVFAVWTAIAYIVAAIAEGFRYGILLRNRTHLIDPATLAFSDFAVVTAGAVALLLTVATAVCCVFWLVRMRRRTFAAEGKTDPRSLGSIIAGCAVPGINLVMPAVFLLELVRRDPRALLLIRLWWASWVLGAILLIVNWGWRFRSSLQAMADGVVLAGVTSLLAAVTAILTAMVIRRLEHRTWRGRAEQPTRWVPAPPGVQPPVKTRTAHAADSAGDQEPSAHSVQRNDTTELEDTPAAREDATSVREPA